MSSSAGWTGRRGKKVGCSLWFHSQRISKRDCGAACQTCSETIITLSQVDELSCQGPTSRADWQYLLRSCTPLPTQSTVYHFSALTFSTVDHFSPEWTCLHQHRGRKVQTHVTTGALKFPSNVILKRCQRTKSLTLFFFFYMIRR